MHRIQIDISNKIIEIECPKCGKNFIKSFDELYTEGSIKCPHCGKKYFITIKK